jgi:SEC-C motif-containing protein
VPSTCPCGFPQPYDACCGRFHRGEATPTAELLMRSRYAAFAVGDEAYLLQTWHPDTRPHRLRLDPEDRWTRLEIVGGSGGGLLEPTGTIEFRAHRSHRGRADVLHENSRFVRHDGRWSYVGPV